MTQAHDYAKIAFDLIDDLDRLTEVDRVVTRVSATLADFGYTSFLITGVPEPDAVTRTQAVIKALRSGEI